MTEQKERVLYESVDVQLSWEPSTNIEVESAALRGHEATQQNLC